MNSIGVPLFLAVIPILAQMADVSNSLIERGAMGTMILWFMWTFENFKKEFRAFRLEQLKEAKTTNHRWDNFTKAMLVVETLRESNHPALLKAAQEMIDKISAREAAED